MTKAKQPDYSGRTVVCLASGPSLTPEDCETVRLSSAVSIVTNATFLLCPWADVLFGFDPQFWNHYAPEIKAKFAGRRVSISHSNTIQQIAVETTYQLDWFAGQGNSGVCAIAWALAGNPSRVILLGFDCGFTGGKKHHHGDHPPGLSNCLSLKHWPKAFAQIAAEARRRKVPVINASRSTELTCFPRQPLEELLFVPREAPPIAPEKANAAAACRASDHSHQT